MCRTLSSIVASETLPALIAGSRILAIHVIAMRHLQIKAAVRRRDAIVGRVPVGHDRAFETKLLAHDVDIQRRILCRVRAVDQVVRIHHRADMRLLHRGLEARQIDLMHRPRIDDRI